MDAARWDRIQTLFHAALREPEARRRAFLDLACGDDARLVDEVLSLLAADAGTAPLLDHGIEGIAGSVLAVPDAPPRRIGPYRLGAVLGEGGMGVVHLAVREDLGNRVAIKMLRDASLSPARRERFALEQRTLARLSHPSIARLYDAAALPDGTPYFVMEYVEGVPLTEYSRANALTLSERLRLFRAVCEAVQFAHRHAVVHRDLKPSNVLVTAEGGVKLLDFGIAKQLDDAEADGASTRTALRMMTPAYAAPEQVRGDPVGTYTDVYALGVILYELLAERLPFDLGRLTPGQVETVILEQEPEKPSLAAGRAVAGRAARSMRRAAWADLDVLCLTAMQKDPRRRYRTVEALIRDVDHFLRGEPLEARPDTRRYRIAKFLRRNRGRVALAGALAGGVVALVGFYSFRLATARDRALSEAARAQQIQQFMGSLFEGGDGDVGPADTLRVVTLLDRGVREAGVLDGQPVAKAELLQTLGNLYQNLGRFDRADSLMQAALRLRRAAQGVDGRDVAASLVALGGLRRDQGELPEAERLVREGIAIDRRALSPNDPALLKAEEALGNVLQARGDYDGSSRVLRDVIRGQSARGPLSRDLATAVGALANTEFYAGNYAASDSLNRRALEIDRRIYGARHPNVADDLINLGAIQFQRGHYADAERLYRRALAIVEAYYGPDHREVASNLTMLGRALAYQERDSEAVAVLNRALRIQETVLGPDHVAVASTLNDLGVVALDRRDFAAAVDDFRRMLRIYGAVYGEKHYLYGIATANLGSVYMKAGDFTRAEPYMRRALAIVGAALSPDNYQTAIVRLKLGHVLLNEGRFAEAEQALRRGYADFHDKSSAGVSWLSTARKDLSVVYDSLGRPADAARFRALDADGAAARH